MKNEQRYIYIKLTYSFILVAYLLFIIRYIPIFSSIPFIFSLDDIFWEMGIIFFLKFIFISKNKIFYFLSFMFMIVMLSEELLQKFTLNSGIFVTTFSTADLIIYILGYILSMYIIYKIEKRENNKTNNEKINF